MKLAGFVLIAAFAAAFLRVAQALPLLVSALVAAVAAAMFAWAFLEDLVVRPIRRWLRPSTATTPATYDEYVDCDEQVTAGRAGVTGLRIKCELRQGHEGDHEGCANTVRWMIGV